VEKREVKTNNRIKKGGVKQERKRRYQVSKDNVFQAVAE